MRNKGQTTVFIIIAILIVAMVGGYFLFRDSFVKATIPASIEPLYNNFLSCLEEKTLVGIDVLESRGGYIDVPTFEQGSSYAPFSNQLDFLGNPIPYWYYVSGNGIEKEQVPSRSEMETQLGNFIDVRARDCIFDNFYEQGFEISQGEPQADVSINGDSVVVNLNMNFDVTFGEDSVLINNHKVEINSNLGNLYDSAMKVYEKENNELFLERYAVDTLRLYAPVDGIEISCAPKIWNSQEVFDEVQQAIESNTLALKTEGNDYSLTDEKNKYFVLDEDFGAEVKFISSRNWPYAYEVEPSEGNFLISLPVGNQPGLGILGFCYVPYHFVYDIKYPVLVQIYSGDALKGTSEIFQFPIAVVLDNNNPRKSLNFEAVGSNAVKLCEYKNTNLEVKTYDISSNPIESKISFECFGSRCDIGETQNGFLKSDFPQCVNGYVVAESEGYETKREIFSTTSSGMVELFLDRIYEKEIKLKLGGVDYFKSAIVTFSSKEDSQTIAYPEQNKIKLIEGQYEIKVQIYGDANIKFPSTKEEKCVSVPQSGIGGLFGLKSEKCYTIETPAQTISTVLVGGGTENYYILESELKNNDVIEIGVGTIAKPQSIEELQVSYLLYEQKDLDINLK